MNRLFATLIAVLVVVALLVVGVGFYRGWFVLSNPEPEKGSNKVDVQLTVDQDKVQDDAEAVKKKAAELTDDVTGESKDPDDRATESVESNDPSTSDGVPESDAGKE